MTREELEEKTQDLNALFDKKSNPIELESASYPVDSPEYKFPQSWTTVFWVLLRTQWKEDLRSKKTLIGYSTTTFIFYAATSAVFFQIPMNPQGGFTDRTGLFFFIAISTYFANTMPIIIRFERLKKRSHLERKMGILPTASILLSQYASAIPLRFSLNIILGTALFYITKAQYEFYFVLIFVSLILMMILASMSFSMMLASAETRTEYCQLLVPFFGIVFFLYGNLSTVPNATWILKWIQYVSLIFYDFQGILDGLLGNTGYLQLNKYPKFNWPYAYVALGGFALLYLLMAHIIYHFKYPRLVPFKENK